MTLEELADDAALVDDESCEAFALEELLDGTSVPFDGDTAELPGSVVAPDDEEAAAVDEVDP